MQSVNYKNYLTLKNNKTVFLLLTILYTLLLSYLSLAEYIKVAHPVFHGWDGWHNAHMQNKANAPLQYRILSYILPHILIKITGISVYKAYLFERFAFLFLTLFTFHIFLKKWFNDLTCVFANLVFILFYNLSALAHIQPAEEPNLFFFILAFYTIREHKYFLFILVLAIGTFNKSTTIFLIPLYSLYHFFNVDTFNKKIMVFIKSCGVTLLFFIIYFGIRYVLGDERGYLGGFWQWKYNLKNLYYKFPTFSLFLFPSLIPAVIMIMLRKKLELFFKAFIPVIVLFTIGHFLISRIDEFRTYMPLAFITIPAMMILFFQVKDKYRTYVTKD